MGQRRGVSLPGFPVLLLVCMAVLWLLSHLVVKRRFAELNANLSDIYGSAFVVPTHENAEPQLIALCVDLVRKTHVTVPLAELTKRERRLVLHACALNALPAIMSQYAAFWLMPADKKIISQLRQINSSKPMRPTQHFGAIKRQQQLRSVSES